MDQRLIPFLLAVGKYIGYNIVLPFMIEKGSNINIKRMAKKPPKKGNDDAPPEAP